MRTPLQWYRDWQLDRVRPYLIETEAIDADGRYRVDIEIVWSKREALNETSEP